MRPLPYDIRAHDDERDASFSRPPFRFFQQLRSNRSAPMSIPHDQASNDARPASDEICVCAHRYETNETVFKRDKYVGHGVARS